MSGLASLFGREENTEESVQDEADTSARHFLLLNLIKAQAFAIGILVGILIFGAPMMQPVYQYFAVTPEKKEKELVTLYSPNMTNRAILSWAATNVTEIMTIGFGDFDQHLRLQRRRFTSVGWESFQKALVEQKVRERFKARQIVLTTVPSDAPVIVSQGFDEKDTYQWTVEMPVIMTFVTNNDVSRKSRSVARLTIVRVPPSVNVGGIAIRNWSFEN